MVLGLSFFAPQIVTDAKIYQRILVSWFSLSSTLVWDNLPMIYMDGLYHYIRCMDMLEQRIWCQIGSVYEFFSCYWFLLKCESIIQELWEWEEVNEERQCDTEQESEGRDVRQLNSTGCIAKNIWYKLFRGRMRTIRQWYAHKWPVIERYGMNH